MGGVGGGVGRNFQLIFGRDDPRTIRDHSEHLEKGTLREVMGSPEGGNGEGMGRVDLIGGGYI